MVWPRRRTSISIVVMLTTVICTCAEKQIPAMVHVLRPTSELEEKSMNPDGENHVDEISWETAFVMTRSWPCDQPVENQTATQYRKFGTVGHLTSD